MSAAGREPVASGAKGDLPPTGKPRELAAIAPGRCGELRHTGRGKREVGSGQGSVCVHDRNGGGSKRGVGISSHPWSTRSSPATVQNIALRCSTHNALKELRSLERGHSPGANGLGRCHRCQKRLPMPEAIRHDWGPLSAIGGYDRTRQDIRRARGIRLGGRFCPSGRGWKYQGF